MSKNDERKDLASDTPIFSIEFDTNNSTIPGVTQLLTPKKRPPPSSLPPKSTPPDRKVESKGPPPLYKTAPTPEVQISQAQTPPVQIAPVQTQAAPEISIRMLDEVDAPIPLRRESSYTAVRKKSLAELGVHHELQFKAEGNIFRYSKMIAHKGSNFFMWQQQFYFKMKLDLKALEIRRNFEEFTSEKNLFYADAFGLTTLKYIQFIRLDSNQNILFVLLSENSLSPSLQTVLDFLSAKSSEKPAGNRISSESLETDDADEDDDADEEDENEDDYAVDLEDETEQRTGAKTQKNTADKKLLKIADKNPGKKPDDDDGGEFKVELAS